jgi:transcription antitermination protein NusB
MSFPSHKFNEVVFQLLFSLDVGECEEVDLIPFLMRELSVTRKIVREAYGYAKRIYDKRKELDKVIGAISKGYEVERIGRVERNVIRCAFYELNSETSQPCEIIISEALRLTRKFSTKEATAYVNALLDEAIHGERQPSLSPSESEAT